MKKIIYIFCVISGLSCGIANAEMKNVPLIQNECDGIIYYNYPNGILDSKVEAPAYYIHRNTDGKYSDVLKNVAVLRGVSPCTNTLYQLRHDFAIPEFIEVNGAFYPVCGISDGFMAPPSGRIIAIGIPDCISRIEGCAFYGFDSIEELTLPASLNFVNSGAFDNMANLKNVYFRSILPPDCEVVNGDDTKVVALGNVNEMSECPTLFAGSSPMIYVPKGSIWFYKQNPCFKSLRIQEYDVEYAAPGISTENLSQTNGVKFSYTGNFGLAATGFSSGAVSVINIPSEISSSDYQCGISMSENPYKVTSIAGYSFQGAANVHSLFLPSSIRVIGDMAFEKLGVSKIVLPASLRFVGRRAFANCGNVTSIVLRGNADEPVVCSEDAFMGIPESAVLYVNKGSSPVDISVAPWNSFKEIKDLSEYAER